KGREGERGERHRGEEEDLHRHERFRRKLGLSIESYEVLRQLMRAERSAAGSEARQQELAGMVADMNNLLKAYLDSGATDAGPADTE
ncbi:hypothetical protein K0U00_34030, partial [Paenibacillus sepulcri]|nr:hypothetical protein [Paenibacillus sepulcri]